MGKESKIYSLTAFDVIIVLLLLAASAAMVIRTGFIHNRQAGAASMASVYHDGKLISRLKLDKEQEIPMLNGKLTAKTKPGAVRIIKSDCPHGVCVNLGWIRYPGEVIICAPNKIVIEIESPGAAMVDAVAY